MPALSNLLRTSLLLPVACAAVIVQGSNSAEARRRGSGGAIAGAIVGGIVAGAIISGMAQGQQSEGRPKRQRAKRGGDEEKVAKETTSTSSSKPKQNVNVVAELSALYELNKNELIESKRNVDAAIKRFIVVLECEHKILQRVGNNPHENENQMRARCRKEPSKYVINVRASTGSNMNQITEGEISSAVQKAYQEARLTDFEKHAGELWTKDRLIVQILQEAEDGILTYFKGVGAKGADVRNLEEVFKTAAAVVYLRAIELSDILGVSHSFDRFIRTIYENSDRVDEALWTVGADGHYERMLSQVLNSLDRKYFNDGDAAKADLIRSTLIARQFAFRFRGRRTLYDCLAAGYLDLKNPQGLKNPEILTKNQASGARIETISASNQSEEGVGASKGGSTDSATSSLTATGTYALWERTKLMVKNQCSTLMDELALTARDNGLKPVSTRYDAAAHFSRSKTDGQSLLINIPGSR